MDGQATSPNRRLNGGPPDIPGVRRSIVRARDVDFHVTEAGSGRPVLVLHGWPQHHYEYRDLLADPPAGLRIIAPDLPGYGWSGPPPHRWRKEDIASDLLALMDALELSEPVLLVGHDWGGWVGYLLILRAPERFRGYLSINISHPWQTVRTAVPQLVRTLSYQPLLAVFGQFIQRRTHFIEKVMFRVGIPRDRRLPPSVVDEFASRFREPERARAGTDTYRTFLLREVPAAVLKPERRRAQVPIRVLFGADDLAIHPASASPRTALADDYEFEAVPGCSHFLVDERPDLVRERLIRLAHETDVKPPALSRSKG
ncbi:alpha/beta fold hydrolase [Nocardia colli]|uniref:alpha/beta fold hydrolase n=1 Tax=Nocardia colli TaxID=2545717 RepID=UPI0037C810C8